MNDTLRPWVLVLQIFHVCKICRSSSLLIEEKRKNIHRVTPVSPTVEDTGFKQLVSYLDPNLVLHGRTFFTQKLEKEFQERRQKLIDALSKCTDAATTIAAWTSRRRSYLGATIH